MWPILQEIEFAINAGLYYLALSVSLSLPDICAALESPNGATSGQQYRAWYEDWLSSQYQMITAVDLYSLRCGVIHQGRFGHDRMQYSRILFTIPNPARMVVHGMVVHDALNLDAPTFCRDMVKAASAWYSARQNDPVVVTNISRLVRFYPQGLAPYMVGVPLIA